MKERIVLWGENTGEEKILLALNLRADENKFDLLIWPEKNVDETFYKKMLFEWREGKDVEFEHEPEKQILPLKLADALLPEGIKTDKTDIINRAQTEWHFIVLSSKLNQVYSSELEDLKDRIQKLEEYDKSVWEELKGFWDKVQQQVREKNLFHEHVKSLRETTNDMFEHMKGLRAKLDQEFAEISKKNYDVFTNALEEIEKRLNANERLKDGFEELKKLQKQFNNAQLTKDLRNKVWNRLDAAFKAVKEARFGSSSDSGNSALQRLERRLNGLLNAMQKMQSSIDRDQKELDFQKHRVDESDGQLESQLRQAKILMIEERIRSKSDKMEEMNKTRDDIERKMVREKAKEEKLQDRKKKEELKEEIKKEIKNQIAEQQEQILEQEGDNLKKAAAALGVNLPDLKDDVKPEKETKPAKQEDPVVKETDDESVNPLDAEINKDISEEATSKEYKVEGIQEVKDLAEQAIEDAEKEKEKQVEQESTHENVLPEVTAEPVPVIEAIPASEKLLETEAQPENDEAEVPGKEEAAEQPEKTAITEEKEEAAPQVDIQETAEVEDSKKEEK